MTSLSNKIKICFDCGGFTDDWIQEPRQGYSEHFGGGGYAESYFHANRRICKRVRDRNEREIKIAYAERTLNRTKALFKTIEKQELALEGLKAAYREDYGEEPYPVTGIDPNDIRADSDDDD